MRLIRLMKHDLAREIGDWVDKDLISESQATSICELYDVDFQESKNRSWGYQVLILLGYLFMGLSVITLLGANWDEIPRSVRMVGLIGLTMGTHALALRGLFQKKEETAVGLFFLGNLFFGASIILISQIYHLGESMPSEVFFWALGTLPFGILLKNRWLSLQSALIGSIWFFLEVNMGSFPWAYIIFMGASLYVLFRSKSSSSLLCVTTVGGLFMWIQTWISYQWAGLEDVVPEQIFISAALFMLLYAVSQWLASRDDARAKDYGAVLSLWALRFVILGMFVLSFADSWRDLLGESWAHQGKMVIGFAVIVTIALAIAARVDRLPFLAAATILSAAVMFLVIGVSDVALAVPLQIGTNIALIVGGVALIVRGIDGGISHYFFVGVGTILFTAFLRYIDLIGDYIGGAILFAVFAGVLLGAAHLWSRRLTRDQTAEEAT